MKENEDNNRGNVILLTVIAIATMIIVVVGATFAYLASSVQDSDSSNINVTTEGGSDLFLIDAGSDIEFQATIDNFRPGLGNLSNSAYSSVTLQTSSTTEITYNYNLYLEVPTNDFDYTSGVCYVKGNNTVIPGASTQETCKQTVTNVWATDGTGYGCYPALDTVVDADSFFTNEFTCLSRAGAYVWEKHSYAELILDLYRTDSTLTTKQTCEDAGKCYDPYRNIVASATTSGACTGENTWVPNVYENNKCYAVIDSKDLTKVTTVSPENYSLLNNVSISATSGGTTHSYKTSVTFVNFDHNQLVNGNKTFNGSLIFERVTETP